MEMKEVAKYKTLWKMNSTSEPLFVTGVNGNPLKKFTIPKIRRTSGKVYLSRCYTNTREYSFIHDTLNECRLDVSRDLQSSWQFGDTKLIHNEGLEKNFTSKRSEMRESGRHGRELEEHFCFLALPQKDVTEIYHSGLSTKASSLRILGNPRLGIYIFRHVDVALNYAHSRSITVESIIIFKVLFGKVKKIQPSLDKSKVSLDPSPNFDCHMSRNTPSLKDTIELQAYSSAVYLYEYNILSKPVDKPRQCLPYAIVTVKFIGQKVDNGHFMTPLRPLATGFPRRTERTCSLNNCTVAKRIGKGKDATVIFEHFRKPIDPFVQEKCSCNASNSEINPSNSDISNSYGNMQNGNISVLETYSGHTEYNSAECRDTSQLPACDSGLSFIPSDTRESVNNGDLLNVTYLKAILSSLAAAFPLHNNTDSSTVITSKFIKDPRLMKRQERMGKHNTVTGLSEILPFEKSLDFVNSETNLSSMPANPASTSEGMPGDQTVVTNYLDASCFRISSDDPQTQAHNLGSKTYDCTAPNKITMAGQCENQDDFSFPMFLSSVAPEVEIQKHKEEKAQRSRQRDTIPFITDESSESHDSYESVNTCTDKYSGPISPESQFSNFKTVYETGHQMSTLFPLQSEESVHEYIQNTGKLRNFTDPEDNAKYEEKQSLWKGSDHSFTNKRKIGLIDNYISLNQDDKEVESLDYLQKNCDQILITQGLEKPKSLPFTTEDKYELSHLALEIQNSLTPRVKKLPSKPPKNSLEYKDNIHTNFAISQKLLELKLEKPDQNCISIMADAFKEAGDIPQTTQLPAVTSCHDIKTAHNANCNITREHTCVQRRNEYDPVSLKDIQRDCKETTLINNKGQHHTQFCTAQLNNGVHLNTDFREQRDNDKENQKEAEMENIASSIGNNIGDIYGDEEQSFQTHKTKIFINIGERRVNKDDNSIEILSSEKFSPAFNLTSGIKHVCTESASLESEDPITIMKEKDIQNTERTGEHLISTAFLQVASSSLHVASRAAVEIADAAVPVVSTNPEDHQRSQFKETCSSESPDFGLLSKPKVSACEIDTDKNRCHNSFHQSVSDNSVLQSFKLDNETEVPSEESDDAFPVSIPQDTHSPENVLYEELEDAYEALESRIDWKGLLGSGNGEVEVLESTTRGENRDQHSSEEHGCVFSSTEKYKAELVKPILLPDLQVTITNTFMKGFSSTVESLASKDDFCKYVTEATKSEINEEEEEVLEFEIHSQCSAENSDHPSEGEFGNIRQDSGLTSKSETSLSFDLSHNMYVNHMSEKQNRSLLTEPSDVTTVNNKNRCSLTKSKTSGNDTRSKKETEARISKRKPGTPFRDQNIPDKNLRHHKICDKRRKLTSQDSLECFFSLSQERIKTFSQSEKHIRSVLDILNSEASLCKSKRLSRKLDRAVLHLKKAHRRVHTSLQLITKVGEKRRGPLPRAYAVICNSFWESCDLQGYSSVSERKYYSTKHFLPKRKYNKPGENRALGFEVDRSLTHVSKHKFYRTSRERLTECLSENVSSVSRSHTTVHMREYCDQVCPESQLALCSVSESTSQSAFTNSLRNPESSEEFQPFSRKTGCLFSPDCPDEKLTKKENRTDTEFSSNISKYEKLENHSALDNIKYTTKVNNSEAKEIMSKRNFISLSCIKENNISFGVDQNYYATCIAHTKVKTDIVISVLESKVWHFFNIDIHKPNNLILSGYKINLEVNFPVEKWTTPKEICKPGIITGNFLMDPLSRTLITSKKSNSIPQLLSIAATDSEGEFSKSSMAKRSITAVEFLAVSTIAPHCVQGCGGNELQKTDSCSSSKWIHINGNETDVENSEVTVRSETEESKDNMMKVFSDDSFLLVKDNIKGFSSQEGIAEKDIQDREMWKDKQAEKGKDSVHMNMTEASSVKTEDKGQKNKILEGSSCLSEKTMKNNLIDPHVKIKKATEAISLRNIASNQLNKRKKEEGKGSHDSQCDSSLHSEIACDSKPGITGRNHMPHLRAHSEPSKVSPPPPKKSTSYMNEFKEKHCSSNNLAPIVKLTQILRRANETSSVQILQEETEVCLNILPLFVEAFERKQKCSFKQILILRDLLVEENLWSNCRHRLKPCAVDSLVELQMMMETIQFIENKKRLLRGEQTFRSLLWYDETLYSELLGRPRGFQQQSNFYPAFQGRLKYNAFSELQNYHDQLIELFEESKRENNSYYTYLKYKRQIDECEAVMKQCSDCFDFSLSVPFTCGVNFGDSLGDLETLRKSTLSLISMYGDCPQNDSCPGKQDHLWIIMEMISSKVNFIKSNEAVNIKIALYGLEHIFFDASKSLVWKEKRQSFCKKYSEQNKEMLLRMNQCAVSKLQKIYDTLSKDLSSEQISTIGLEEDSVIASRKSNAVVNKAIISVENSRLNGTLLSHPDICCVSEILDQAEFADVKKLQELTLRCTDDLEILKKCFQFLQEDSIDSIFITEENSLNMMKNYSHKAVILKPAAVETYIEIVMLSETIQFLKNSVAKKLDRQRFRSLLWFDLSLLPELVHCQEKMTSFSFLKGNPTDCLGKVIETAISELKKDLDIIYKYNEAVNGSYALRLLSRELEELSEIKKLIEESKYSVSTYINFVPCIASINYGSTVTELEYNYSQFSTLLGSITATPRKDLGKMVHIVKIMKTIEHMKIICVKNAQLTVSFILCQMLHNRKKTLQPKRKKNANIHVKRRKRIKKSSTCRKVPLVSEYIIKNVSNSSKKRPITVDTCGDSEEQEKSTAVPSCKKQKVSMKHVTEIKSEKSTFKHARTMRSHSESENEIEPDSSDSLKRSHVSPKQVETQRSLPLMNLKDSEDETDLTDTSFATSEDFTRQQGNISSTKKRNINFSAAETKSEKKNCSLAIFDQKSVDGTFSKDQEMPPQKFLKNLSDTTEKSCPSDIKPGTDASLLLNASEPIFRFVSDSHANLEMNDTDFELQDNEILNSSINSTCTSSPEPMHIQNKIPVVQINKARPAKTESKEKYMKDTLNFNTIPVEASENITLSVNQTVEYSLSEQQNSKVLTQNAATYLNEIPQSMCTPEYDFVSGYSFETSYPYYSWCIYRYSSSNDSSITQTYQGITSYEVQPPPSGILTAATSNSQNTHSHLLCSQYFEYFAGEPQANDFVPVSDYFPPQMPVYNFQQPVFSQYTPHQLFTAYPCSPDSGALLEVPWTYDPCHQEPFQPGH